jgi:hypothetical protein
VSSYYEVIDISGITTRIAMEQKIPIPGRHRRGNDMGLTQTKWIVCAAILAALIE